MALIFYLLNVSNIRYNYKMCNEVINKNRFRCSDKILFCLHIAEDKRNKYHYGVDFIGIIRAIIQNYKKNLQGASTIEQQFVRTITSHYDITIKRKFNEIILAVLVCFTFKKKTISFAYLSSAYYGVNLNGRKLFQNEKITSNNDIQLIAEIISRLKYPEPKKHSSTWEKKIGCRKVWIINSYNQKFVSKKNSFFKFRKDRKTI